MLKCTWCFDTGECLSCQDGTTPAGEKCQECGGTGRCIKCGKDNDNDKENENVSKSSEG